MSPAPARRSCSTPSKSSRSSTWNAVSSTRARNWTWASTGAPSLVKLALHRSRAVRTNSCPRPCIAEIDPATVCNRRAFATAFGFRCLPLEEVAASLRPARLPCCRDGPRAIADQPLQRFPCVRRQDGLQILEGRAPQVRILRLQRAKRRRHRLTRQDEAEQDEGVLQARIT